MESEVWQIWSLLFLFCRRFDVRVIFFRFGFFVLILLWYRFDCFFFRHFFNFFSNLLPMMVNIPLLVEQPMISKLPTDICCFACPPFFWKCHRFCFCFCSPNNFFCFWDSELSLHGKQCLDCQVFFLVCIHQIFTFESFSCSFWFQFVCWRWDFLFHPI